MMNLGIVPWPLNADLTGYWTMWGTVATAIGTVGLVVVAWFAWRAALETLRGQQIGAEMTALKDYMDALHALSRLSKRAPAKFLPSMDSSETFMHGLPGKESYERYVTATTHDVLVSGSIWRAYHGDEAAGQFGAAEDVLVQAQGWRITPKRGTEDHTGEQFELNSRFAVKTAAMALRWQVQAKQRGEVGKELVDHLSTFWNDSPCRPDDAAPANSRRRTG